MIQEGSLVSSVIVGVDQGEGKGFLVFSFHLRCVCNNNLTDNPQAGRTFGGGKHYVYLVSFFCVFLV